jgi:hypothetical protein
MRTGILRRAERIAVVGAERGKATPAPGHERRGVSRAVLAAAEETVVIPTRRACGAEDLATSRLATARRGVHAACASGLAAGADRARICPSRESAASCGVMVVLRVGGGRGVRRLRTGFAPVGAVVVTPEEAGDLSGICVVCRVNGEQRQDFAATGWIHSPAEVVSFLSGFMTLQLGDLITIGTSSGIGIAEVPPRLLQDGDIVQAKLSGYPGTSNTIRLTGH